MSAFIVGCTAEGLRVGQDHQRAKLTDRDVELIRLLAADGMRHRLIAEKFDVSRYTVGRICRFERRAAIAVQWRPIGPRRSILPPSHQARDESSEAYPPFNLPTGTR